jgi:hypothetical protein
MKSLLYYEMNKGRVGSRDFIQPKRNFFMHFIRPLSNKVSGQVKVKVKGHHTQQGQHAL